jgi:hypothetical protein
MGRLYKCREISYIIGRILQDIKMDTPLLGCRVGFTKSMWVRVFEENKHKNLIKGDGECSANFGIILERENTKSR